MLYPEYCFCIKKLFFSKSLRVSLFFCGNVLRNFKKLLFLFILCLLGNFSHSQCISNTDFYIKFCSLESLPFKERISFGQKLLAKYKDCDQIKDSTFATAHKILSSAYRETYDLNNYSKQLELQLIFLLKEKPLNRLNITKNYLNQGLCYMYMQHNYPERSLAFQQKALQYSPPSYLAKCYLEMAFVNYYLGDFTEGIKYSSMATHWARKQKDTLDILYAQDSHLDMLLLLGQTQKAKLIFDEFVRICEIKQYYFFSNLGKFNERLGDFKSAEMYFKKTLKYAQLPSDYISTHSLWAECLINKAAYSNAKYHLDIAESYLSSSFTLGRTRYFIYASQAKVARFLKQYDKAFFYQEKALTDIGFTLSTIKNSENVIKTLHTLFSKKEVLEITSENAHTHLSIYLQTKQKSHLLKALNTYELADKLVDLMRNDHQGQGSKFFWREATHELYENAIKVCFLLNNPEKAFYFIEKSKASLLNDALNSSKANQLLSKSEAEKEKYLKTNITKTRAAFNPSVQNTGILLKIQNAENEYSQFIKSLEKSNKAYFNVKYDQRFFTIKQVQEKLKLNQQSLVDYFVGDSMVYALNISENQVIMLKLPVKIFQKQSAEYVALVASLDQNEKYNLFKKTASDLYESFIKPLGLVGKRVAFSPDGNFFPFESLLNKTTQRYLLEDMAVSYVYSAKFYMQNLTESKRFSNTFLGFAPVKYQQSQHSLLGASATLGEIAKHFTHSTTFTFREASKENFAKKAPEAGVLQLFTHAQADENAEPRIYFSDSTMSISDFYGLDPFKAQLVSLSACETAKGEVAKGEGVMSLSRSFAMLGVPATITTLWSVDEMATYEITKNFYRFLKEGNPKDIALQKARLLFMQNGTKEQNLPYYWAGNILVGASDPLIFSSTTKKWWILCIGFTLAGLFFYVFRKIKISVKYFFLGKKSR